MNKLFSFILGIVFFLCPLAVEAEEVELMPQAEIAEVPALDPMTESEINDLLGEDPYIGETDWRGHKASSKRDYSMKNKNR